MVELFDALGVERADFVCNSWGGTIAIAMAAEHPDRVRSLVVTGSMPVFYGPARARCPRAAAAVATPAIAYFGGEGPTLGEDARADGLARVVRRRADPGRDRPRSGTSRASTPARCTSPPRSDDPRGDWQDLEDHLRRIRCRALFCWGMHDGFLTPDYPLMLARMVPHGQLYVMDHASHHLQEERPWDYVAVVEGFLAQSEPERDGAGGS